jgi:hypothetical protein
MPEHEAALAVEQLGLGTQHKLVTRASSPAQHSTAQHKTVSTSSICTWHAMPCPALYITNKCTLAYAAVITSGAPATNRQPAAAGLTLMCWGYCLLSVGGRPG